MWQLKQYLVGPAGAAIKFHVALPNSVNTDQERALRTYFEVIKFL